MRSNVPTSLGELAEGQREQVLTALYEMFAQGYGGRGWYQEVATQINQQFGLRLSDNLVRKAYKRWSSRGIVRRGIEALLTEMPQANQAMSAEVQALRKRVTDLEARQSSDTQERTVANLRSVLAVTEKKLKEAQRQSTIAQLVKATVAEVASTFPPPPRVYVPKYRQGRHQQEAVLLSCCLHLGEVVHAAETNGFGGYDISIAQARMQRVVDGLIDIIKEHHAGEQIQKLWVVNLGDNVSGTIHDSLTITNEQPIVSQVLSAAYLWGLALRDLCANFETVECVGLVGNHGRTTKKPATKEKVEDSYDRMVYEILGILCQNLSNFTMTIPEAYWHYMHINKVPFLFLHGDGIRSWGQIPFYGLYRASSNFTSMHASRQEYFRYMGIGHHHQLATLPRVGGEILMTGSLLGGNEFSLSTLQQGADPTWLFFGVHEVRGVSFRYPINTADATAVTHARYQFDLAGVTLRDMAKKVGLL